MVGTLRSSVLSYNKYLRQSLPEGTLMTISMQSQQELQSVLAAIRMYAERTKFGKANNTCRMTISLTVQGSEETT